MSVPKHKKSTKKWYEKYLPFIAKSSEVQIEWLNGVIRKNALSMEEITPYIRLLLAEEGGGDQEILTELFKGLDEHTIGQMVRAADIYDVAPLFRLIAEPTVAQAVMALEKLLLPMRKKPHLVFDKVFLAVHDRSETLFEEAAAVLRQGDEGPEHFEAAYERFQEILADERILSALYPRAKN